MSSEARSAEHLLLKTATTLLAQERREDAESFNLFTVLRSGSDEVNLHSRFLHALLDHRTGGQRRNLAAFLALLKRKYPELGDVASLDVEKADIHREKKDIDLLINDSERALVIENKIYAGDQPKQLDRYYKALEPQSLTRHVVYLTLDGREPSSGSKGDVPDEKLSCVSYVDLLPWLETCHKLASEDPALRSSVAQYRQLLHELTGGGLGAKQMDEMKKIIRESRSLTLARDLGNAADELFVDIVHEMWKEIDAAVKEEFEDEGLSQGEPSAIERERIKQTFGLSARKRNRKGDHGLYYPLPQQKNSHGPALGIEIQWEEFFFGIRCLREDNDGLTAEKGAYAAIQEAVRESAADFRLDDHSWWPCYRYALSDSERFTFEHAVKLLEDTEWQKHLAKEKIAKELRRLWTTLKNHSDTRGLF